MSAYYYAINNFLNCSWKTATYTFWLKYPNSYSQHVLSEDVLERRLISNGQLYTRRLLCKTNPLPSWGRSIFKSHMKPVTYVVEESIVDPANQVMKIYAWNTMYKNMMHVQERITITPHDGKTEFFKEAWIDSSLTGLRTVLKTFGTNRWKTNAKKAFYGFEEALKNLENSKGTNVSVVENKFSSDNVREQAKLKAIKKLAAQVH